MDIVFVNSINFVQQIESLNSGTLILAKILKDKEFDSKVIDFDALLYNGNFELGKDIHETLSKMAKYILKYNPKIVSFYTMCNSYPFTIKLAEELKKHNSSVKILLGGPQATLTARETLQAFESIDAIGIGEGEETIVPIVNNLLNSLPLSELRGVAYRIGNRIGINETAISHNLDELPIINLDLMDPKVIPEKINIDVGRGCPFGCTFCSTSLFWKRKYRLKSIERIIDEIKLLKVNYGISMFSFTHDMFTMNKDTIMNFCEILSNEKLNISWSCSARVDTLDEDLILSMKNAGCKSIFLGIETGSDKIQKRIKKNINLKKALDTIKILKKHNIDMAISLIYGFFDETYEDIQDTLNFILKLLKLKIKTIQLHRLIIMPGTEEYELLKNKMYIDNENINLPILEGQYSEELFPLVKKHKDIFMNFYEYSTDIRDSFKGIDVFVSMISILYNNFNLTFELLLRRFDSSLDKIFIKNKDIISEFKKDLEAVSKENGKNMNLIVRLLYKTFSLIVERTLSEESKTSLDIFKFEKDKYEFINNSNEFEYRASYTCDVLSMYKNNNMDLSNTKAIEVLFMRKDNGKIAIKMLNEIS